MFACVRECGREGSSGSSLVQCALCRQAEPKAAPGCGQGPLNAPHPRPSPPSDASIWLHQFLKGMRDDNGDLIRNAHLLGFFRRICRRVRLPRHAGVMEARGCALSTTAGHRCASFCSFDSRHVPTSPSRAALQLAATCPAHLHGSSRSTHHAPRAIHSPTGLCSSVRAPRARSLHSTHSTPHTPHPALHPSQFAGALNLNINIKAIYHQ